MVQQEVRIVRAALEEGLFNVELVQDGGPCRQPHQPNCGPTASPESRCLPHGTEFLLFSPVFLFLNGKPSAASGVSF
jgi:hypothetical protein